LFTLTVQNIVHRTSEAGGREYPSRASTVSPVNSTRISEGPGSVRLPVIEDSAGTGGRVCNPVDMVCPYVQSVQDPTAEFADVHDCVTNKRTRFTRCEKIPGLSHRTARVGFQARIWREETPFPLPHVIETASVVARKVRTVAGKGDQVQHIEKSAKGSILLREFPPPLQAGLGRLKCLSPAREGGGTYCFERPSVSSMRVPTGSVRNAIFRPNCLVMSVGPESSLIPSAWSFLAKASRSLTSNPM